MNTIDENEAIGDPREFLDRMDREPSQGICNGRLFTHSKHSQAIPGSQRISEACIRGLRTYPTDVGYRGSFKQMVVCHATSQSVEVSGSASTDSSGNTSTEVSGGYSVSSSDDNGNTLSGAVSGSVSQDSSGNTSASVDVSVKYQW